jgi:hypothetical protein
MSTENKKSPQDSKEPKNQDASQDVNSSPANQLNSDSGKKQEEPPVAKELSVSEIFTLMKEQTVKMKSCRDEIALIKSKATQLKARKKEIQSALKAVGNVSGKINVLGIKKTRLGSEDRLLLKAEKEFIKNELILLIEQKWIKMKELKQLVGSNIETSKNTQLRNKSMSNSYITRNRWSIESRVIETLNKGLKSHKENLLALQKLAILETEVAIKEFSESLENFLDTVDSETYVLCSHQLRSVMHASIRLTLKEWDAVKALEFTKLSSINKQ